MVLDCLTAFESLYDVDDDDMGVEEVVVMVLLQVTGCAPRGVRVAAGV